MQCNIGHHGLHFYCEYAIFSTTKRLEALSISIEDSCHPDWPLQRKMTVH